MLGPSCGGLLPGRSRRTDPSSSSEKKVRGTGGASSSSSSSVVVGGGDAAGAAAAAADDEDAAWARLLLLLLLLLLMLMLMPLLPYAARRHQRAVSLLRVLRCARGVAGTHGGRQQEVVEGDGGAGAGAGAAGLVPARADGDACALERAGAARGARPLASIAAACIGGRPIRAGAGGRGKKKRGGGGALFAPPRRNPDGESKRAGMDGVLVTGWGSCTFGFGRGSLGRVCRGGAAA